MRTEKAMEKARPDPTGPKQNAFWGNYGLGNLSNDCTFQAILAQARWRFPTAEFLRTCAGPEDVSVHAVPMEGVISGFGANWRFPLGRLLRRIFFGIPIEMVPWIRAFAVLKGADFLIVPGTQVLSDALTDPLEWIYSAFK